MTKGIFRPRQAAVQRLTPNAGNRAFIAGGKGPNRLLPTVVPHRLARALVFAALVSGGGPVAADGIPMPPAAPEPPPPVPPIPVPAAWESQR